MYDKLKPLYTLIGITYLCSINPKSSPEVKEHYKKHLSLLVEEYQSCIKNKQGPDIQIIKK